MNPVRRLSLFVLAAFVLASAVVAPAQAAVELTGRFTVDLSFGIAVPLQTWEIVQTGTTLTVSSGASPFAAVIFSGTIDPDTGVFNLVDRQPLCVISATPGVMVGTASDSDHFSAEWTTDLQGTPTICSRTTISVTGVRDLCSNGILDVGEQCDGGRCCADNCRFAANGLPCDDGDALTTNDQCVAGACAQLMMQDFEINAFTTGTQSESRSAATGDGQVMVVWHSYAQQQNAIWGRRLDGAGRPLGAEFQVNSLTTDPPRYATVAGSSTSFLVAWERDNARDSSDRDILARRYARDGAPVGTEFQVNTFTSSAQVWPGVAMDAAGNTLVVWSDFGQNASIVGRRFDSTGTAVGTEFFVNGLAGNSKRYPAVAALGTNSFVVVWNARGASEGISAQLCDATGPVGTEIVVTPSDVQFQGEPAVAADARSGSFLVVWSANLGRSLEILGRLYTSAGTALGPSFVVNSDTLGDQTEPTVASEPGGTFLVLWTSPTDGTSEGIFAQRFMSDGTRLGRQFLVPTYGVGRQSLGTAAPVSNNRWLVTWTDWDALDGDGLGVFGRVVPPAPAAAACHGDCNGNGSVTIDELVLGVNIALDRASVDRCTSLDVDDDGHVAVNEIVAAVKALLAGCPEARLIALSREGQVASLDIAPPWPVRKSIDLGAPISSARCRAGRCLVVHPSPTNKISVVDAIDLALGDPIELARDADPRDVAFVDDDTAVVSQYGRAELLVVDLTTRAMTPIDLSGLADEDGIPEALQMANCGRRVFVQLRRVDHDSDAPAAVGAALAVVDLDRPSGDQIVDADPITRGTQGIALAGRPKFDMPIACGTGMLYVAEPAPLFQGGGGYEQVDLNTLTASDLPIDTGAEVGGFAVAGPDQFWIITHTDIGPGPSSHLNLLGGTSSETYNTFADEHIDNLAFDAAGDVLFFPDACVIRPNNQSCDSGIHVFAAHTGPPQIAATVKLAFPPIEVTISR